MNIRLRAPSRFLRVIGLVVTTAVLATVIIGRCGQSSSSSPEVELVLVIDGDTIDVMADQTRIRVRILGIDTPETAHRNSPAECYSDQATTQLIRLLGDPGRRQLRIENDPTQPSTDRYGRTLAYLHAHGKDVGAELIRGGYAHTYPGPGVLPQRLQTYQQLQREARNTRRGLWGTC